MGMGPPTSKKNNFLDLTRPNLTVRHGSQPPWVAYATMGVRAVRVSFYKQGVILFEQV